jgi:hypothetical protein
LLTGCGGEGQPPAGIPISVSGILTTDSGVVVANTTVYLIASNGNGIPVKIAVGPNGGYNYANIAAGVYWLWAPGYLPVQISISAVANALPAIAPSTQATYSFTGSVASSTSVGISGATVSVTNTATELPVGSTTTSGTGGFSFALAAGLYTFTVSLAGYHTQIVTTVGVPTQTTLTITLFPITGSTGASGS